MDDINSMKACINKCDGNIDNGNGCVSFEVTSEDVFYDLEDNFYDSVYVD